MEFYVSEKERKKTKKIFETYFDKVYCSDIEDGIYDYTKQGCSENSYNKILALSIYKDITKNLIFNLEENQPTICKITKAINKNKFNAYNLAYLRPEELDRDNWIKIILRNENTEKILGNLPTVDWDPCTRCNNIKYSFYQLQTRSIDEPITTFYICKKCGKNYSVNV